jgi:type IV pilus assembly protein PilM
LANALSIDYHHAEKIKLGIAFSEEYKEAVEKIFNQTCTQWVLEIKKAIDLYLANNPDKPLNSIVLSGGGSKVSGLKEYIARETALDVISFNPFSGMMCDDKKIDAHYLSTVAPEMAIATGLAIRTASF